MYYTDAHKPIRYFYSTWAIHSYTVKFSFSSANSIALIEKESVGMVN